MAHFYTYETIAIPLTFTPDGVLEDYRHIIVSIKQYGITQIDKTEEELDINVSENTIGVRLSQEETSTFEGGTKENPKTAEIQVNIYYNSTDRDVSTIKTIDVYDNLYKKVLDSA